MAKTVFAEVHDPNCWITVSVAIRNGNLANGKPKFDAKTIAVNAYIRLDRPPPKDVERQQPGNAAGVWCEGRVLEVIDPQNPQADLPPEIPKTKDAAIACEVAKTPTTKIAGKLWLVPKIQSGAILQYRAFDIVGQKFWGWFVEDTGR